jgi:hypothetical protein
MYFKNLKSESVGIFGEVVVKRVSIEDTSNNDLDNQNNQIVNDEKKEQIENNLEFEPDDKTEETYVSDSKVLKTKLRQKIRKKLILGTDRRNDHRTMGRIPYDRRLSCR